ncbi:tRNA pseudouridine(55) synthase TruB [Paenisporosarcina cavernae]|uniref:tRNA pseudouridine synthase B n=1 Tax=Paenisporosarcina cavernae TaxID=2320858 RepID=A0A385YUX4_9BACL|nr:tRNA pseudouridine(55) synthase TruB [Paenisporosarcina cavernae]AYC29283.1 tRNA pseudouridine(55) synthase TruB [Paenisporosarcina cavernae]
MNGILPLWKEKGMTSHDCVFKLRKILHMKRIGHTGTLDPSVEGVLPICIGESTKVAEYLTDSGKEYIAEITIGSSTTTEDADGEVLEENDEVFTITREELQRHLNALTGEIEQIPPMYSAVKVNGKKLYEYARKGLEVERPKRTVTIHEFELLDSLNSWSGKSITFTARIACSKGTYIRTLATQVGELLGYPAHMSHLERTKSASFKKDDCYTLQEVQDMMDQQVLDEHLFPIDYALQDFPHVEVPESMEKAIQNGQVLEAHTILEDEPKLVWTKNLQPFAVYVKHPTKEGKMKPEKMFVYLSEEVTTK